MSSNNITITSGALIVHGPVSGPVMSLKQQKYIEKEKLLKQLFN